MTDWVRKMNDTVQPHVPDSVLSRDAAAGRDLGSHGPGHAEPVGGDAQAAEGQQIRGRPGERPDLQAGEDGGHRPDRRQVYAFSGKPAGRGWKIKDHLATWERKDLAVATEAGKLATKVTIDVTSTGDHYELEATTSADRGFTEVFLAELAKV